MFKIEIEHILEEVSPKLDGCFWIVGGSAALVLHGYLDTANDIDIIQHSGPRVVLSSDYEVRIWSRYYDQYKVDLHYSNPFCVVDYDIAFHKIIAAIDYIDTKYSIKYKDWFIATPLGAGLINWVHHFLEYGYNSFRTICPEGKDVEHLKIILTVDIFDTISWKVEMSRIQDPTCHAEFEHYAREFSKNN